MVYFKGLRRKAGGVKTVHRLYTARTPPERCHARCAAHHIMSRTSVSLPVIAAAAAIAGDIRCVRPPRP